MSRLRLAVALAIIVLVCAFFVFDLGAYLSLEFFTSKQAEIEAYFQAHPLKTSLVFFLIYVAVTGLSLPGAAIMTLAAGAVFGLIWGTVLVSFASTIGATLAFLASRFLLRDIVHKRFGQHLATVDAGVEKDGIFYLFTLRLVPIFPFFMVNLLMGLTTLRTVPFFLISQIGMLAGTIVYVNAGTQIAHIETLRGILSPDLIISFTLLGLFPLIAKKLTDFLHARKALRRYAKPERFDRDLVVIGAGSAGLVAAYVGAAVKARVTLIEKHKMGGDCLNTGCVPSKALIRSARFIHQARHVDRLGLRGAAVEYDFAEIMERVQRVIRCVAPHDSVERYTSLGVDCRLGQARIVSPYHVEVGGETLTTRSVIVAAGARPFVPPIPGLDQIECLTSDNLWDLRELPKRLLVLGGGPIGCELAQCFARLGSQVTQVEMLPRLLIREDPPVADLVMQQFREDGVDVRLRHRAKEFRAINQQNVLICEHEGEEATIEFDRVLVAVGRAANTAGYGLEELDVRLKPNGTLETDEYLQATFPNMYGCGDVVGPYQFTHVSAHQAWYATVNALFGGFKKLKVDYSVIPWATFTDPEVARVGLNELEAQEKGIDYELTVYEVADLDRAIADEEARGVVRVLTVPGKDKILGATIVASHAGDLLTEYIAAMRHGFGMNKILGTIHIYPTMAEANKYAAGEWKRAHAPQRVLAWLERYHAWRRG